MVENEKLKNKCFMILTYIKLGMTKYRAYLLAELDDEEIKLLDNDDEFQKDITITEALLEKNLLEKYEDIMEKSSNKGNPNAVQWMLSKINPDRWGNKVSINDNNKEKVRIYLPDNGR